jgi:hypothetical protein
MDEIKNYSILWLLENYFKSKIERQLTLITIFRGFH